MIAATYALKDDAKIAARAALADKFKPHLQLLDDVIAKHGGGSGYCVHGKLSIADVHVYVFFVLSVYF